MDVLWILGAGTAGIGALVCSAHNRLVTLDTRCESASADIDVQMKHRHALLPNLFEAVKGFTAHERGVLEAVVDARAAVAHAVSHETLMSAEAALGRSITQLVATAESYPDLQSSEHFRALRGELADTENKIAAARRYLNATVTEYNSKLRQFPANVVATLTKLKARAFYDIGIERVLLDEAPSLRFEQPIAAASRVGQVP